jgi:hypothetical protein
VGNKNKGNTELPVQVFQLFLHLLTQLEIERAEGFVEQQYTRLVDQRPGERDPLPLAT